MTSGSWRVVSSDLGVTPRAGAVTVWDGCEAIVIGGWTPTGSLTDTFIYKP